VFSKVVLKPGCSIGYHQHKGEFEAYYVVSGKGLVRDGENKAILNPGDMNLCKDGDWHGIENAGEDDLVLFALIMNQLNG
jgi:quercetin dioxygenase-like cupin family protein